MDYPEIKKTFLNILNRTDVSEEEADSLLRFGITEVSRILNTRWQQKAYKFEASSVPGLITYNEGSSEALPIIIDIQGSSVSWTNPTQITIAISGDSVTWTAIGTGSGAGGVESGTEFDLSNLPNNFETLRSIYKNGTPMQRVFDTNSDGYFLLSDIITVQSSLGFDPKDKFTVEYFTRLDFDDGFDVFFDDAVIYSALSYACDVFIDSRKPEFQQRFKDIISQIQTAQYEREAVGFMSITPLGDI